jgi:hypothetical protein
MRAAAFVDAPLLRYSTNQIPTPFAIILVVDDATVWR